MPSYAFTAVDGHSYNIDSPDPLNQEELDGHIADLNGQLQKQGEQMQAQAAEDAKEGRGGSYGGTAVRSAVAPFAGMARGVGEFLEAPSLIAGGNDLNRRTAAEFPVNPAYKDELGTKVIGTTAGLAGSLPAFLIPGVGEFTGPASVAAQTYDTGFQSAEAAGAPASTVRSFAAENTGVQAPLMIVGGKLVRNLVAGGPAAASALSPMAELGVGAAEAGAIGGTSRLASNLLEGPTGYNFDPDRGVLDDVGTDAFSMAAGAGVMGLPRAYFRSRAARPPAPTPTPAPTPPATATATDPVTPPPAAGTGGVITDLKGGTHQIVSVEPDGTAVATAADGTVNRWTPDTLKRLVAKGGSITMPGEAASTPVAPPPVEDDVDPAAPIQVEDEAAPVPRTPSRFDGGVDFVQESSHPGPDQLRTPAKPSDQPVVNAAAHAAEVAAAVEPVAPATADALRAKTSQVVVDHTEPAAAPEPEPAPPVVEPPVPALTTPDAAVPPAADDGASLPAAPGEIDPPVPTPDVPVPPAAAEELLPTVPPQESAAAEPTSAVHDETPSGEPVLAASDEPAVAGEEEAKGSDSSPDATVSAPAAQADEIVPPDGGDAARVDERGKPITVVKSDAADPFEPTRDPAKGSRTESDQFTMPAATREYMETTSKLPRAENEDAVMTQAHKWLEGKRSLFENQLSGWSDFHPADHVIDDSISRFHRQLREGKIDPAATGQKGQKPNVEQALKTIMRSSMTDFMRRADTRANLRTTSLDAPVGEEGSATRQDLLPAPTDDDRAENAYFANLKINKLVDGFLATKPPGATIKNLFEALDKFTNGDAEKLSAKQLDLVKQFQKYARANRRSVEESVANEDVDRPQGDTPATDPPNGRGEPVRQRPAPEPTAQRSQAAPEVRGEPAPATVPNAGQSPEGKAGFTARAGQRVSHGGRAADVQNIDGDTATVTYKGSKKPVEVPVSELKPAIVRSFTLPDSRTGQPDIIDAIVDNGGIIGKGEAMRTAERRGTRFNSDHYDPYTLPDLKGIYQRKVFGGSETPDTMAAALAGHGMDAPEGPLYGDGTVETMYRMIDEAMQSRKTARAESDRQATLEKQQTNFDRDVREGKKGSKQINSENLSIGDVLTMDNGEKLTVTDIDDEENVELSDGEKYGLHEVEKGKAVWYQKIKRAPKVADDGFLTHPDDEPPVKPAQKTPERLPGTESVAQRITNAENSFIDFAMRTGDLTREQAEAALAKYHEAKAVKIDKVGGQFSLTHGDFAERAPLRRAAGLADEPAAPLPKLRSKENQGDLLSTQSEDLTLVGERGVDHGARQAEQERVAGESEKARAAQERDQMKLPGTADAPTDYDGIQGERRTNGDKATAATVGLTPAHVADFDNGTNETGINPHGFGQDGLTMEIQRRRGGSQEMFSRAGDAPPVEVAAKELDKLRSDASELEQRKMRNANKQPGVGMEDRHPLDVKRGKEALLRRLDTEASKGGLPREQVDVMRQFINDLSDTLLSDNALSIVGKGDAQGSFDFGSRLVKLMRANIERGDNGFDRTFIHEVWHGLSRFLPAGDLEAVRSQYAKEQAAYLKANPWFRPFIGRDRLTVQQFNEWRALAGDKVASDNTRPLTHGPNGPVNGYDLRFTRENYRFHSLDEWFAETMADRTLSRYDSMAPQTQGVFALAKQLFSAIGRAVVKLFKPDVSGRILDDFLGGRNQAMRSRDPLAAQAGDEPNAATRFSKPVRTHPLPPGGPAAVRTQAEALIDSKAPTRGSVVERVLRGVGEDVGAIFRKTGRAAVDVRNALMPTAAGNGARETADVVSANAADLAAGKIRGQVALTNAIKAFNRLGLNTAAGRKASLDIMDRIERGVPQASRELQGFADQMRDILDDRLTKIQGLGTGKLSSFIQEYFPHIWEKPEAAASMYAEIMAKRPLEGPSGFLKTRTIDSLMEGVAQGLDPVSWNPAELTLLKIHEMDRYLMAHNIAEEVRGQGLASPIATEAQQGHWAAIRSKTNVLDSDYVNTASTGHVIVDRAGNRYTVTGTNAAKGHVLATDAGGNAVAFPRRNMGALLARGGRVEDATGSAVPANFTATPVTTPVTLTQNQINTQRIFAGADPNARLPDAVPADHASVRLAGQEYAMQPDAARIINNYLSPGLNGKPVYDVVRKSGSLLNQAQLGLSMFHAGFVMMDTTTSKASLGLEQIVNGIHRGDLGKAAAGVGSLVKAAIPLYAPVETFLRGSKVLNEYTRPGSVGGFWRDTADALQKGGGRVSMDDFYSSNAIKSFKEALAKGNHVGAVVRAPLALVEAISHPLMQMIVPRMKLGVFSDLAAEEMERLGPGASLEAQRAAFRKAWDTVDNRLGQVVYDNLFWNKVLKDSLMVGVRSVGWNLGTIRELGGGIADANPMKFVERARAGDPLVTHRIAYAMALPMLAGITGSMIHYLHTGQHPQDWKDALFPRTGKKNRDGSDERLTLPTYIKDVFAYKKEPLGTVLNKVNPLVSMLTQMYQNKDYYGGEIRNTNDPLMQQIGQELHYLVKTPVPFSVTGLGKRQGGGPAAVAESFLGVTPAPAELSRTAAENAMVEAIRRQLPSGGKTPEEMERAELRRGMMTTARTGQSIAPQVQAAVAAHQMTPAAAQRFMAQSRLDPKLRMFQSLGVDDARRVFDLGTTEEKRLFITPLRAKEARAGAPLTGLAVAR